MSKSLTTIVAVAVILFVFVLWRYTKSTEVAIEKPLLHKSETPFHEWKEYQHPEGLFKVHLPTLPQHANEALKDPKTHDVKDYEIYVSEADNGNVFMITVIAPPSNEKSIHEEVLLDRIVEDMLAANPNSKLKSTEKGEFQKAKSVQFSIEKDQTVTDGIAFIVNNKLFVLSTVSKNETHKNEDFDFFTHSFELLSQDKK